MEYICRGKNFLICILIIFVGVFFIPLDSIKSQGGGSLYFSPSTGIKLVGETFSVVLRTNTGGVAINAAEGSIVFDPAKLQVISLSKIGSIFSIWVAEPTFSNAEGTIEFAGGLPNPGYSGSNGLILTINLKAKTATTLRNSTEIVLISGAILANDGEGTNILASLGKASFYISPTTTTEPAPVEGPTGLSAPIITSKTHPDQNKWYSSNDPEFEWRLPKEVEEVRLVLSKRPESTPQISYVPPISSKKLEDLDDGIWYLHGQFCNYSGCGGISTFKFQIDTAPPDDFEIIRVEDNDKTNPQPELIFETEDEISGIDRYEMKIGEGKWFAIDSSFAGKPYALSLQAPGTRDVSIKAVDKADNTTTTTTTTTETTSIEAPIVYEIPQPVKYGNPVTINGEAKPFYKIEAYIASGNPIKLDTVTDKDGLWSIRQDEPLKKGVHEVHAYARDERGAVSVKSNSVILKVESASIFEFAFDWLMKGFDALVNFIIYGWLLIIFAILIVGFIYLIIKEVIPFVSKEFRAFVHIIREYRLSKQLKKRSRKMSFELKSLYDDIKSELSLLEKIEKHRGLHPDEKYIKEKLEKYLRLLKALK